MSTVWFRKAHYTDLVYNDIMMGGNRGSYTGVVLLDLPKAFDTVDNATLFIYLKCSGQRDKSREWL